MKMDFRAIPLCLVIFAVGCERYSETTKVTSVEGSVISESSKADVGLHEYFGRQETLDDVNEISSLISGFRYHTPIEKSDRDILVDLWLKNYQLYPSWNPRLVEHPQIRVTVAEILYKVDPDNAEEYRDYILAQTQARASEVRANAIMGLALIGDKESIPLFISTLLGDKSEMVAIQAGFALLAIEDAKAKKELLSCLIELADRGDRRSTHIVNVLQEYLAGYEELHSN